MVADILCDINRVYCKVTYKRERYALTHAVQWRRTDTHTHADFSTDLKHLSRCCGSHT